MEAESLAQARKIKLQEEDIIDKERLLKLKVEEIINLKEKIKDSNYEGTNQTLKKFGYVERLVVKRNYKYKTVRTDIRLTKEMEEIFIKGGSNITVTKNERRYFLRIFDATIAANDLLKAIYKSTMEEDMGKGLQMKGQDEIIGKNGVLTKLRGRDVTSEGVYHISEDKQFIDAPTSPKLSAALVSTVPRSKEERKNYNKLNEEFSERIEKINDGTLATSLKSNKDTEWKRQFKRK
ncbi:hypothetical protein GLOIN_2v1765429 [Rhizophagus irregularis DAOM 181602=DAOM 197198]|uniref:Uncharacterized protein n=2 Tax=Rhizophagus irregularis TaxID=588596 RepID=A0A2P4QPB1_RHIID|nr:hypothetical protein GLOIN_2v1765429 [Rhizophagus irregularis DAOM 181602=DAOM 197198]POG79464.1 hypothetical protein GLOIN_2v1765429 [Rhizophagus irregularis DAOM 181602=DAOM 197198]|eukprot:XP_025186330.1 hypothetical protein GLOIN_2v1765429 [Rhizophagus irregularis DAOM 181602=DAOM 197198]